MWTHYRLRTMQIMELGQPDDPASRLCDILFCGLIAANVTAVILESVPAIHAAGGRWFAIFEVVSVLIFTVEYLLRLWSCVEGERWQGRGALGARLRYMLTPLALIDLVVILPFYVSLLAPVDLRFMRVFRLLRLLKLTRYSRSISLMLQVMRDESRSIGAALFILSIMLVLTSSLAYLAEYKAQPEVFGSIPEAMWWAVITMTTVGYGDVTPVTVAGKVIAAFVGIIGIGMVALPAGILASGFNSELHRRSQKYSGLVDDVLADGVVTPAEQEELRETCERLGLSESQAAQIFEIERRRRVRQLCPHCGRTLAPAENDSPAQEIPPATASPRSSDR